MCALLATGGTWQEGGEERTEHSTTVRLAQVRGASGGAGGGGAQLTAFGEALIRAYRSLEVDIESLARVMLAPIAARAKPRPEGKTRRPPSAQRRRLSHTPSAGPGRAD